MSLNVGELQVILSGDPGPLNKALGSVRAETQKTEGFLKRATATAAGFLGAQVVQNGLSKAFHVVTGSVFGFNSTLEQANIGFTTMLGSGKKAQAFLDDLADFAKKTPFEFEGLVKNSQLLLGMGIDAKNVRPYLTALGDSVASVGGNADTLNNTILAFGQIAAKGTLSMDNMNQLLQGGVPTALKVLAAQFHVTTGEMVDMISSGKVSAEKALPLLVKGLEDGTDATAALGGMMDKQSATFGGALSNIKDAVTQSIAHAFLPQFKAASGALQDLAGWLGGSAFGRAMSTAGTWVSNFGTGVGDVARTIATLVTPTVQDVARNVERFWRDSLVPTVANLKEALLPILQDIGGFLGGGFLGSVKLFGSVLADVVGPAIKAVSGSLADNKDILEKVIVPLAAAIGVYKAASTAATLLGTAFGFVQGTMRRFAATARTTAVSMGPVGIALAVAGGALALFGLGSHKAKKSVDDLTSAIKEDSGALGENTRATVFNRLQQDGVIDVAQKLGLNINDVTDAVLGNTDAQARLNTELDASNKRHKIGFDDMTKLVSGLGGETQAVKDGAKAYQQQVEVLGDTSDSTKDLSKASQDAADAARGQTDATTALSNALDLVTGKNIDATQAQIRFRDGLAQLTDSFKENGRTVDINTSKGRDNLQLVLDQFKAAGDVAEAKLKETGSVTDATAAYDAQIGTLRKTLEKTGLQKSEVDKLVKAYGTLPKDITTKVIANTEPAKRSFADLLTYVEGLGYGKVHSGVLLMSADFASVPSVTGHRAAGGRVAAGMPYTVGEMGVERFVPDEPGVIIPNGAVRGGDGANAPSITINVNAAPGMDVSAIVRDVTRELRFVL